MKYIAFTTCCGVGIYLLWRWHQGQVHQSFSQGLEQGGMYRRAMERSQ